MSSAAIGADFCFTQRGRNFIRVQSDELFLVIGVATVSIHYQSPSPLLCAIHQPYLYYH